MRPCLKFINQALALFTFDFIVIKAMNSFHNLATEQSTILDQIPEREEGEPHKEAERSAKVGDQGEERVDEELLHHGHLDAAEPDHQPEGPEVLLSLGPDLVLKIGASGV